MTIPKCDISEEMEVLAFFVQIRNISANRNIIQEINFYITFYKYKTKQEILSERHTRLRVFVYDYEYRQINIYKQSIFKAFNWTVSNCNSCNKCNNVFNQPTKKTNKQWVEEWLIVSLVKE